MLTYLHILDFAIIDALELDVRSGLTVLTGETGAGKSYWWTRCSSSPVGRAGAEVVRHGAQRAEVTATFELAQAPRELKSWLEDQAIGVEQELSVRRVVTTGWTLARLPQRPVGDRSAAARGRQYSAGHPRPA